MPRKSKSNPRKSKKPKQEWRVKQLPTRNWLELPPDLMVNILQRVGVADKLEKAQLVCTAWRDICDDPAVWKIISIDNVFRNPFEKTECQEVCKHAVHRSQGQLLDLTLIDVCDDQLLQFVAVRSSQLRRLEIVYYFGKILSEALKKFPLLEELSLVRTNIFQEDIEAVGRYCPLLKTLKLNQRAAGPQNNIALAIGKNLPGLINLQLIGNNMKNTDLQAILNGCCRLESLDLRGCVNLDLEGDLGKRCSQQIKYLKLPHDSFKGYPYVCGDEFDGYYYDCQHDENDEYFEFFGAMTDPSDYDDHSVDNYDGSTDLEN